MAASPVIEGDGVDAIPAHLGALHDDDHRGGAVLGIALLADGKRRRALESVVSSIFAEDLAGRVLPFDSAAAREYAVIAAARRRAGRPIAEADAQIAAIARSRGATVATRNVEDFTGCGISLVSPWEE